MHMAHPVPTMCFLQLSPEAVTLFAPFGCTHPLVQNLSPKNIAPSDIISWKLYDT